MGDAKTNVYDGMKVAITVVSVLFDLFYVGVLPEFFGLDIEIYTTGFIYNEILQSDEKNEFELFVRSGQLKIIVVEENEQETISNMKLTYSNRSIADKTALYKAMQMECILLTCDDKLKKEAIKQKLEVHGSIWIIDQLLDNDIIDTNRAIEVIESLKKTNSWLPVDELDRRLTKYKGKG
jgi:predicted nucleic acid-binding protein